MSKFLIHVLIIIIWAVIDCYNAHRSTRQTCFCRWIERKMECIPNDRVDFTDINRNYYHLLANGTIERLCGFDPEIYVSIGDQTRFLELKTYFFTFKSLQFLSKMTNLNSLVARYANITRLSTDFKSLHNLKWLDLSFNRIERLDGNSAKLPNSLTHLILRHNRLAYIEPGFFSNFTRLVELDLADNLLEHLSVDLSLSIDSTYSNAILNFSNNRPMTTFDYINVSSDKSFEINVFMHNLNDLQAYPVLNLTDNIYLCLFTNYISYSSALDFHHYAKGQHLGNKLFMNNAWLVYDLDQRDFLQFERIAIPFNISLDDSQFKNVPNLSLLNGLISLEMRWNRVEKLDDGQVLPPNVKVLDFSHNRISFISEEYFSHLKNLTELYLSDNTLTNLHYVHFTSAKFKILKLDRNQLEHIGEIYFESSAGEPVNLKVFNLSDNNLKRLPIVHGTALSTIDRFVLSTQHSNEFLNNKPFSLLFKYIQVEKINSLNLKNCHLTHFACDVDKKLIRANRIDLRMNEIEPKTLCEAFYDHPYRLQLKYFPQLVGIHKLNCEVLRWYHFKFKSDEVVIKNCALERVQDGNFCASVQKPANECNYTQNLSDFRTKIAPVTTRLIKTDPISNNLKVWSLNAAGSITSYKFMTILILFSLFNTVFFL